MKLKYIVPALALCFAFTACDDDDDNYGVLDGLGMVKREVSIADGATVRPSVVTSLTVSYNNLVGIDSSKSITLNGSAVTASVNPDNGMELLIPLTLESYKDYVLTIPEGAVYRRDNASIIAEEITVTFNTNTGINFDRVAASLTNANATQQAKNAYSYLRSAYGSTMLSGAMGAVAWGTEYADMLASETGAYPAIIGFDYIHLASSPANWIDYGDITPVKTVWEAGSIPAMSWHWNVPTEAPVVIDESSVKYVVWEGEQDMGAWSGYVNLGWQPDLWADTEVGDVIEVVVSHLDDNPQGSFKNGNWTEITSGTEYFEISGNFYLTVTQEILDELLATGLVVGGQNYTAVKVQVCDASAAAQVRRKVRRKALAYNTDCGEWKASNVLVSGTWENDQALADVEKLAGYLKLLQDAGIPVLWRPFHEAAGDYTWGPWFWWGMDGTAVTKQLWIWLHDKLTNEYGLNNLIWVWTMQTSDAGSLAAVNQLTNAYPGDSYVDIVGADIYPNSSLTDQSDVFNLLDTAVNSNKIVALSECGNLIDPAAAYDNDALWSFFMQWYDMDDNGNFGHTYYDGDQWITVAWSPYVTNQSAMPSLK